MTNLERDHEKKDNGFTPKREGRRKASLCQLNLSSKNNSTFGSRSAQFAATPHLTRTPTIRHSNKAGEGYHEEVSQEERSEIHPRTDIW